MFLKTTGSNLQKRLGQLLYACGIFLIEDVNLESCKLTAGVGNEVIKFIEEMLFPENAYISMWEAPEPTSPGEPCWRMQMSVVTEG